MEIQNAKNLLPHIEKAIDLIESSDIDDAIRLLKHCEILITQFADFDTDILLIIHHNIALCMQMLQDFEECAVYLQKTHKIAISRVEMEETDRIRNVRYLCMISIQIAAIMSHQGEHHDSVLFAKEAFNQASQCLALCTKHVSTLNSLPDFAFQNSKTLESILSYLSGKLAQFPMNCKQILERSPLGVLHYTDWIFSFTINDILDLKPLRYFELKNSHTFLAELSKDFMLQKVCLIVASCYLVATETRLLDDEAEVKKAKNWHKKSVEIANALIPIECPLMQHVKLSYIKHYPVKVQKILKGKSKTPVKDRNCKAGKSKTPVRPKAGAQRKVIKNIVIKTDRSFISKKPDIFGHKGCEDTKQSRTQREDNQEPEPPISEDYSEDSSGFFLNSNDLYGSRAKH